MELRCDGLIKKYGKRSVVNGISLNVLEGEIVGLLGPNGAGKTTTFYMIVGFIPPDEGRIFLGDDDVTSLVMYKRARAGIGYLAQEPSIFRGLTVEENLLCILEILGFTPTQRQVHVEKLLDELGIAHLAKHMATTLSGGERRRCEIARTLVTTPKFILLDEPFSGIDPITVSEIARIIKTLKEQGIGILITDHNVRDTLNITDRAYIVYQGKVLLSGEAEMLVNDPRAKAVYLGEGFRI